jgi:hypothetical protein
VAQELAIKVTQAAQDHFLAAVILELQGAAAEQVKSVQMELAQRAQVEMVEMVLHHRLLVRQ